MNEAETYTFIIAILTVRPWTGALDCSNTGWLQMLIDKI